MTVAEQLEQRGLQKGIQIGIEKGIEKGESQLLKKQLQKRFGQEGESYQVILVNLSIDELEMVAERLMTPASLEEIFKGIPKKRS